MLAPQPLSTTGQNQWLPPALRGPPPGFTPRLAYQPQAHLTGTGFEIPIEVSQHTQSWYPDTGATLHVTNNVDYLSESIALPGTDQVLLGNGQGLPITSIGTAYLSSPHTSHTSSHAIIYYLFLPLPRI